MRCHEVGQADDARTGQRQLAQGFSAGGMQCRRDLQAVTLRAPQRPVVERHGLCKTQQAVLCQMAHLGRPAVGLEVRGAGQHAQAVVAQRAGMQRGVAQRANTDGHIGVLLQQVDHQVVGVELQLDLRELLPESGHQRHDDVQHVRHGGVDPQAARGLLAPPGHLLLGLVHRRQDGPRTQQEVAALFGQHQSACGAVEQRGVEFFLQPPQGPADARHRLPQLLRCRSDGAAVHHGAKRQKFIQCGLHC